MTSTTTIEETGWTRVNGNVMRWVQPLGPEHAKYDLYRQAVEVKGGRDAHTGNSVILLSVGNVELDRDLSDEDFWEDLGPCAVLPEDACYVLWHALGSALNAMGRSPIAPPSGECRDPDHCDGDPRKMHVDH